MNESAAHSTSYGFVDLTGDENEFSPFDVIDLTHVPKASAQCSVVSSRKLPTQNPTNVIDLTEDESRSRVNEALDKIDKKQLDIQSSVPPTLAIVDLTEEFFPMITTSCTSEYSTIQVPGDRSNFEDTNAHLNDRILRDEKNSVPSLPVIGDSIQSLLCPVTTTGPSKESASNMGLPTPAILDLTEESLPKGTCPSGFLTVQKTEDRSTGGDTNALTDLNGGSLWDEQNSVQSLPVIDNSTQLLLCPITTAGPSKESASTVDLPTPAILDLTEESLPKGTCPSGFLTVQITEDRSTGGDTNALTDLNGGSLRGEQNSVQSLSVIDNSTQSLLCPITTAGPSKESASTVDLPTPAILDLTEESFSKDLNGGSLLDEQNSVPSLPVIGSSTQSLLCAVTTTGSSRESVSTMDLPKPGILDLTKESLPNPICSSEFLTVQIMEGSTDGDTNALTHSNGETLLDENNYFLSLQVACDSTQSLLSPLTIPGPANKSACEIDSQSMPAMVELTDESLPCPVGNTCHSEFSTMQVTQDHTTDGDTNERTHLNDGTLWDEQNSAPSLPVGDSTQSLLCPLITARSSNESAATIDWENIDDVAELNEHFESLQKKIADLESTVVDLNDDNDTSFLVIEEYKAQACQIYEKITKKSGEPTKLEKDRIKFNGTPFPKFNEKLERYVNKKRRLPVFQKFLKRFKTYNRNNNWQLNEKDCYQLVEDSFGKIGKKLQNQRYVELNDLFAYYTNNQVDPAELDPELKAKLDRK